MTLSQIRVSLVVSALQAAAAPADGGVLAELAISPTMLTDGTGAYQADRVAEKVYDVAGSGSQSIDLTTLTDAYGTAIGAAGVVALVVVNERYLSDGTTLGGGQITVGPNASNGWTGGFADASDRVKVAREGAVALLALGSDDLAVGASSKVVDIINGNSGTCRVRVIVLARSA